METFIIVFFAVIAAVMFAPYIINLCAMIFGGMVYLAIMSLTIPFYLMTIIGKLCPEEGKQWAFTFDKGIYQQDIKK